LGKSSPKLRAISVIFQKLPKANNRPLGENSPNLVTLLNTNPALLKTTLWVTKGVL
jgi:hypothetical protein